MASEKQPSIRAIRARTAELMAEASEAVGYVDKATLEALLLGLYDNICALSRCKKPVLNQDSRQAAWRDLLAPINSLGTSSPHGDFLAARMVLYLMEGFLCEGGLTRKFEGTDLDSMPARQERGEFLTMADDALLASLLRLWTQSRGREEFAWVFSEYPLAAQGEAGEENSRLRQWASALNLEDLAARGGPRCAQLWVRPDGDTTYHARDPEAHAWGYECVEGTDLLMWQRIGDSGPIWGVYSYHNDMSYPWPRSPPYSKRYVLNRSNQFIADARLMAARNVAKDRRLLARGIMDKRSLPAELQLMVLANMEVPGRPDDEYVYHLDLVDTYRAFPPIADECSCPSQPQDLQGEDLWRRQTCPSSSIVVWNLVLREFQTFHRGRNRWAGYRLCKDTYCPGHHTDDKWVVQGKADLYKVLAAVVQSRCGAGATLESVGLGPVDTTALPTLTEDIARMKAVFDSKGGNEENLNRLMIGLGGLVDTMLHGRVLRGRCRPESLDRSRHRAWTCDEPCWVYGYTREDELEAIGAIRPHNHSCELCLRR